MGNFGVILWGHAKVAFLVCLAIASLFVDLSLLHHAHRIKEVISQKGKPPLSFDSYSFIGRDYPPTLPVKRPKIRITVEESVHYALTDPESPDEYLWTAPYGDNHIRLGPEMRAFAVSMFHQLHCLRGIREALALGWNKSGTTRREHLHHCFNYIRRWTLCNADLTLEPGEFTLRNFTTERLGATHTCVDWQPLYDIVNDRWFEWEDYKIRNNVPQSVDS